MAPAPELRTTDRALWNGYGGAIAHDGVNFIDLVPGETIFNVPRAEAEASEHWIPLDENDKPLKPKRGKAAPSESAGTGEAAGAPSEQDGESA